MVKLRDMTIRGKLTTIIMVVTAVTLLLAIVSFVTLEQVHARQRLVKDLFSHTEMVGDNCKAALTFSDAEDAGAILASLDAQDSAVYACIYDKGGDIFAEFSRGDMPEGILPNRPTSNSHVFMDGYLLVSMEIELDGEIIGSALLVDDMSYIRSGLVNDIIVSTAILFCALGIGYLLSSRLQKVISEPILSLAGAAERIGKGDLNYKVQVNSNDELGQLARSFNKMTEDLRITTTSIDNLNAVNQKLEFEITKRKQTEESLKHQTHNLGERLKELNCLYRISELARQTSFSLDDIFKQTIEMIPPAWHYPEITCAGIIIDGHRFTTDNFEETEWKQVTDIIASGGKIGSLEVYYLQPRPVIDEGPFLKEERSLIDALGKQLGNIIERKQAEDELRKTHGQLVEASRRAGMAEVATDVLHNVGNILNSINVTSTLIREKVSNLRVAKLKKVSDMLNEHADDLGTYLTEDSKGKHVPVYLTEIAAFLNDEQVDIIDKLESLTENVNHIKEIISVQQSYAKVSGLEMSTSIEELIENAIHINSAGLERHGARLERKLDKLGMVEIDKQRVLQILVNLISNAKYAISGSGKEDKVLTVRAYKHGEYRLRIEVTDNGIGIAKENLTRIFEHGFTTKKKGHGFGLHSGALTAKEMGGSLTVHSQGPGQGATFILELPYKPAEVMT